jgi:hypothetical protein
MTHQLHPAKLGAATGGCMPNTTLPKIAVSKRHHIHGTKPRYTALRRHDL